MGPPSYIQSVFDRNIILWHLPPSFSLFIHTHTHTHIYIYINKYIHIYVYTYDIVGLVAGYCNKVRITIKSCNLFDIYQIDLYTYVFRVIIIFSNQYS